MDQPQIPRDSKNLGLQLKTLSAENYCNLTSGEEGIDTVGGEFGGIDVKDKLVNVTTGARGSSTTGLASDVMQVKTLINVTGPQKTGTDSDMRNWLRLLDSQSGASSQPEKADRQRVMDNREVQLEGIISRIEELMASMPPHFDLPLREFFRPNLATLCATTGDGIIPLIQRLQEMRELDDDIVEELHAMTTNRQRCERVYRIVAQRRALRQLIVALDRSNNGHVISLMESWL